MKMAEAMADHVFKESEKKAKDVTKKEKKEKPAKKSGKQTAWEMAEDMAREDLKLLLAVLKKREKKAEKTATPYQKLLKRVLALLQTMDEIDLQFLVEAMEIMQKEKMELAKKLKK
jgi:hypothetical protein